MMRFYFLLMVSSELHSTRPFLLTVEKMWIAFQLCRALQQCHEIGVQYLLVSFLFALVAWFGCFG
jgi:hypothetical protein